MHRRRAAFAVLIAAALAVTGDVPVQAQVGPGGAINPGRDCQTVRNCRFTTGGSFRGCVSSYSCRVCKVVATRCELNGVSGTACQKLRCTWGG